MPQRTCRGCGTSFEGKGRACWCSERCRKQTLYGGTCLECGAPTSGTSGPGKAAPRCKRCQSSKSRAHAGRLERDEEILALRARGLLNTEIAERMGVRVSRVARAVYRMRQEGVDVAPTAYHAGRPARARSESEPPDPPPSPYERRRGKGFAPRCRRCGEHLREPADLCGFCLAEQAEAVAA